MRRLLILALSASIAALATAPAADAASSKRCRALVKKTKGKVVKRGKNALVARRGSEGDLTLTYTACLYPRPRLYRLPGQNGGDTEFFHTFKLAGRYVAYVHQNVG